MKIEEYIKSLPGNIISGDDVQLPDDSFRKIFEFLELDENDKILELCTLRKIISRVVRASALDKRSMAFPPI